MQRSNEFLWATVAALVCGIGLASLLTGTGVPLLAIVVVVAAGAGLARYRRRPYSPYGEAPSRRRFRLERRAREPRSGETTPSPTTTRRQPRTPGPTLGAPSSRRAGARSTSLGAPQDRDNRSPR